MDSLSNIRPNGTGFVHLSRQLQPGEAIPSMPSLLDQLQLLASRTGQALQQEPPAEEHEEAELAFDDADDLE